MTNTPPTPPDAPKVEALIEEIAVMLDATVKVEEGLYHVTVPVSLDDEDEDEDDDEAGDDESDDEDEDEDEAAASVDGDGDDDDDDEEGPSATVTISASDDGTTLFATRVLTAYDDTLDLELLLREVGSTVHAQLSIDEDGDLVVSFAAPTTAPAEWIADAIQELAEFAPGLEDEEYEGEGDDENEDAN